MNKTKKLILLAASAVLLLGTVGTTLAYLFTSDGPLTNIFSPSRVVNEIEEDTTSQPGVKKDVTIKNTGDTDAYIRAKIIATWVKLDDEGEVISVYSENPVYVVDGEDNDYTITGTDAKWLYNAADDCYYYTDSVVVGGATENLIGSCTPVDNAAPDGYVLSVEILSQAIQAEPDDAVESAWPVTVNNDGTLALNQGGTN